MRSANMFAGAFALLLLSASPQLQAENMDQTMLKARAATSKSVTEVKTLPDAFKDEPGIDIEQLKGRRISNLRDLNKALISKPALGERHALAKLAPGRIASFSLTSDNMTVEGSSDPAQPPSSVNVIEVSGSACVIRNLVCRELILFSGAKVSVVDSVIESVQFPFPGMNEEAKKTKCEFFAGNCVILNAQFAGPKDYERMVRDEDGGSHMETVKVNSNNCQFKFKNCSLLTAAEPLFTLSGDIELELSKCAISAPPGFCEVDREMGGKSEIQFEDCAIHLSSFLLDKTAFTQKIKKEAGQCVAKGKLIMLDKPPFAGYPEQKAEGEADPDAKDNEKPKAAKKASLPDMFIREGSPALQLGAGAFLGENGMPDAKRQLASAAGKPLPPIFAKAKAEPKDGAALPKEAPLDPSNPQQKPKDDKLSKELEDAAKKLEDALKKP